MINFEPPTDDQIAELTEKHGSLTTVEDGDNVYLLAKPSTPRAHLDRMVSMAGEPKKKLEGCEGIVKACVVYPDKDTLKKVLADEPGLALSLAEPAMELVGVRQLTVKKG
jgi:hypothetical protein